MKYSWISKQRWGVALLLASIVLAGTFFRFFDLGRAAMGIDVMEFYKVVKSGISPLTLMLENPPCLANCSPLWFAIHNAFHQLFNLDVTFQSVRLMDSFAGVCAIGAAFLLGRFAYDDRTGLLCALFVALHPVHIQMARESYFYMPITLGCFLFLAAVLCLMERIEHEQSPGILFYLLVLPGYLFSTNLQISSWAFAFVVLIAMYWVLIRAVVKGDIHLRYLIILTIFIGLISLPPLFSVWGLRCVYNQTFGPGKQKWGVIFGEKSGFWGPLWHIVSAYLMGLGGLRSFLSAGLAVGGVGTLLFWKKKTLRLRSLVYIFAVSFVLLTFMHWRSVFLPAVRYYSSLSPLLVLVVCLFIVRGGDLLNRGIKNNWFTVAGALVIIAFNLKPAWLSTQIDGSPPFKKVSAWVDRNLPHATPVLCDRWFTPWNEFQLNPSTNAFYTFTVPNEPLPVYKQNQWRNTAITFFEKYPSAAFFDAGKFRKQLGEWKWPSEYFDQEKAFRDDAGLQLDTMGLWYRAPPRDIPREWLTVKLRYNTPEDLVRKARVKGNDVLRLYGKGWGYAKPGWQQGRFEDYRTFTTLAELIIYNLTAEPLSGSLEISAASAQKPKTVLLAEQRTVFSTGRIRKWSVPLTLVPGENRIQITSPVSTPLFVLDTRWKN
jgi:hypothetical protein